MWRGLRASLFFSETGDLDDVAARAGDGHRAAALERAAVGPALDRRASPAEAQAFILHVPLAGDRPLAEGGHHPAVRTELHPAFGAVRGHHPQRLTGRAEIG